MLPDPLISFVPPTDSTSGSTSSEVLFRLSDLSPGRTVRVGSLGTGIKNSISISHLESKENKGIATDRSSIRISSQKNVPDIGDTTAAVNVTFAFPRSGFTTAEMVELLDRVLSIIRYTTDGIGHFSGGPGNLERILLGEP